MNLLGVAILVNAFVLAWNIGTVASHPDDKWVQRLNKPCIFVNAGTLLFLLYCMFQ